LEGRTLTLTRLSEAISQSGQESKRGKWGESGWLGGLRGGRECGFSWEVKEVRGLGKSTGHTHSQDAQFPPGQRGYKICTN